MSEPVRQQPGGTDAEPQSHSERFPGLGPAVFTTVAHNTTGVTGESWITDGMRVRVASPLADDRGDATNPEELLALSWATCLNAAARVVAGPGIEVAARCRVSLHQRTDGSGFEFSAAAELEFADVVSERADELAVAAHARCPVSRLFAGTSPVTVRAVRSPR